MTHIFYNGIPPYCFEIAIQILFKKKIANFFGQEEEIENHEKQISMLSRIKVNEEAEERRIKRLMEIRRLKQKLKGHCKNPTSEASYNTYNH